MRVLFCRITWMEKYIGREFEESPMPFTGGKYMGPDNIGGEEWNFVDIDGYCYGYVETKSNRNGKNKLNIERIDNNFKNLNEINNVLVVWVSKNKYGKQKIVGWYKNATVYREYQFNPIRYDNIQYGYNIVAKAKDCTLLPIEERTFEVPVATNKGMKQFGFGQANVWYANEINAKEFVDKVVKYIENYNGNRINEVYTEEELEDTVEIDETNIDKILEEIESLIFNNNDFVPYKEILKCIKICNSIIRIEPNNEDAHYYKFMCLIALFRFKKAIREAESNFYIKDYPEKYQIENILVLLYFYDNNIDKALEIFRNIPDEYKDISTYITVADIYKYLKDYDNAKMWYERALEIDDKNIEAYFKISYLECEVYSNNEKALYYLDKIIEIDNKNIDALYGKATILNYLGKKQEALKTIDQGLKIDSNDMRFIELKKVIQV